MLGGWTELKGGRSPDGFPRVRLCARFNWRSNWRWNFPISAA
ncbi:hypothetical protein [Microcoleus sp. AR_TQ3_B6]